MALAARSPDDIVELEQAVLALCLLDGSNIPIVGAVLLPEHFGEPLHQRIFAAMQAAAKLQRPCDPFTLRRYFEGDEAFEQAGGSKYLVTLLSGAPLGLDIEGAARNVLEEARRREIADIGSDLIFGSRTATADQLQQGALGRLLSAQMLDGGKTVSKLSEMPSIVERAWAAKTAAVPLGVATGFEALDNVLGGLHPGDQMLVGARTGTGKSAVVGAFARNMATAGHAVHIVSAEMTRDQLVQRMLTDQARELGYEIAYRNLRSGQIEEWEREVLERAEAIVRTLPITIDDRRNPNLEQVYASCRQSGARVVIVDHIQVLDVRGISRLYERVTEASKRLKAMWGELGVPGIVCSQVNRQTEARGLSDRRPTMGDLRESGALEQDADIIALLYREEYYLLQKKPPQDAPSRLEWNETYERCKHKLEINVAKNRMGEPGIVYLHCDMATSAIRRWNGYG